MFLDRSWPIRGGAADIYMPLSPVKKNLHGISPYMDTKTKQMNLGVLSLWTESFFRLQ